MNAIYFILKKLFAEQNKCRMKINGGCLNVQQGAKKIGNISVKKKKKFPRSHTINIKEKKKKKKIFITSSKGQRKKMISSSSEMWKKVCGIFSINICTCLHIFI
ncbi:hypothetical protein ACKWTF_009916 [Chironomus riparius]